MSNKELRARRKRWKNKRRTCASLSKPFARVLKKYADDNKYPVTERGRRSRSLISINVNGEKYIFTHHTTVIRRNSVSKKKWYYKDSHLNEYLNIDPIGFSGKSVLGKYPELIDEVKVEIDDINVFFEEIYNKYVYGNVSKISKSSELFISKCPYLLFTGQVATDSVIKYSYFGNYKDTLDAVLPELNKIGIKIMFRPHPKSKNSYDESNFDKFDNIIFSNCDSSIHSAIENSIGVITINSGTGFEGLLHCKPVFTLGSCDYKYATYEINKDSNICETITSALIDGPPIYKIKKLVYIYLKKCCVSTEQISNFNMLEFINSYCFIDSVIPRYNTSRNKRRRKNSN